MKTERAAEDGRLDPSAGDSRIGGMRLLVVSSIVVMVALVGVVVFAAAIGSTSSVRVHAVCGAGPGVDPRSLGFDVERVSAAGVQMGAGRIETTHRLFKPTRYRYVGDDGTRASLLSPIRSDVGFSCP